MKTSIVETAASSPMNRTSESVEDQTQRGITETETPEASWKPLYRVAGFSALATAVLTPLLITVFAVWPPPYEGSAEEWFELFRDNQILGLISLDLGFVVVSVLLIPVMVALYIALRHVNPSLMAIAGAIYFVAVGGIFASNPSIEMSSLSNAYAAATTDAERAALLGGGEGVLAGFNGTAFHAYYILGQTAGILIGLVMLRSHKFSKWIAYSMIAGNAVGFGLYIPTIGLTLSAFSGVILWIWMILISRSFFLLGRAYKGI